jgi:hypothetical protein
MIAAAVPRLVMPGLVPGIHAFVLQSKTWMAGTSPAMTADESLTMSWYYFFCGALPVRDAGRVSWVLSALSGSRFHTWLWPNREMPR